MNHLSESQLNEYLDNALSAPERLSIKEHLSGCADCQSKMENLQSLFQTLAELPEEALHRDLAPFVKARLAEQKISLGWKLVLAVQAGIAIGLTIPVISNQVPFANLPDIFTIFTLKTALVKLPAVHYHLPILDFHASTASLVFLAASALLLWGVGNAALLRGRIEARK